MSSKVGSELHVCIARQSPLQCLQIQSLVDSETVCGRAGWGQLVRLNIPRWDLIPNPEVLDGIDDGLNGGLVACLVD